MSKAVTITIDEETGETQVEAHGYTKVNGVCQGVEATKFITDALGGVKSKIDKPDVVGGRRNVQSNSTRQSQR